MGMFDPVSGPLGGRKRPPVPVPERVGLELTVTLLLPLRDTPLQAHTLAERVVEIPIPTTGERDY